MWGKILRNLNISLTGQNLFVITNYKGFDPEVNTDGAWVEYRRLVLSIYHILLPGLFL
jgi:hypothetical protein